MRINELILELQKKAEEYGNVEVFCRANEISPVLKITPIGYLDNEEEEGFILLSFDKLENIVSVPIEHLNNSLDDDLYPELIYENSSKELLI